MPFIVYAFTLIILRTIKTGEILVLCMFPLSSLRYIVISVTALTNPFCGLRPI